MSFKLVFEMHPIPCVGALIFNDEGKVLLVKAPKWSDKWTMPGGHVKWGETMEQALKREIKEETNLEIEVVKLLVASDGVYPKNYFKKKHFVFLDFLCKPLNSEVKLNDEATDFKWIEPRKALEELDVEEYAVDTIETFLKEPRQ